MMNNLSWFLYAADVVPNLSVAGFFLCVASAFFAIILAPKGVEPFGSSHIPFTGVLRKETWFLLVLGLSLYILTPSKETIYLIAGSEAGETVVTSEEGQEILSDIHEVIKYQLGQLKGENL